MISWWLVTNQSNHLSKYLTCTPTCKYILYIYISICLFIYVFYTHTLYVYSCIPSKTTSEPLAAALVVRKHANSNTLPTWNENAKQKMFQQIEKQITEAFFPPFTGFKSKHLFKNISGQLPKRRSEKSALPVSQDSHPDTSFAKARDTSWKLFILFQQKMN